ncbi:hypothetical protein [Streptomyces sp. NPDC058657]|uniref:hypothetical protein n=1 Tax=unclassified Streptomyces TaxID=2593676 RepID=UPI003664AB43
MPTHTHRPHLLPLLLTTALVAATLTGCTLLDAVAADCAGTEGRVEELAGLDVLDSRPAGAAVARGFEKVDAGCWADSGEVVLHADRTYSFPGTREEVSTHYRALLIRDGWTPDPLTEPDGLTLSKDTLSLHVAFLTAERLAEDGHGSRPDLTTGAGYSIGIEEHH